MAWDLLIKNGTIFDGTGLPGFKGDIAVQDGRIERIGKVDGEADRVLDAEGTLIYKVQLPPEGRP